jgi:glycosyltransferase involved in cell wall biosynthesis
VSRPLKIVRIIARLNIGGPAIHVALLTSRLNGGDFESTLVAGSVGDAEGDMSYYAAERGVSPLIIPDLGRELHPVRDIRTLWKLYRFLRRERPDVVHTHTAKAGFVGRWAAKFAGVPVIVHTFHGHVFHGYFGPARTRLFITLEQLTSRITDSILTLTQSLRRELALTYRVARTEKITVLPLGLDLAPFAAAPRKSGAFREQYSVPQDAPLVGIAGRMVPVKNHALFLEAAAQIRAKRPDVRFVMIGDGELRDDLERQIDNLGLRGFVKITGWLSDMPAAYADMDVFALSSVNEGTPVTVIEALSAGCPVVATHVGGIPDLLEGGRFGALVSSGNAHAFAQAILDALENPPDTRAAQAAMLQQYGIDRLVSDLSALYKGLLARKRG